MRLTTFSVSSVWRSLNPRFALIQRICYGILKFAWTIGIDYSMLAFPNPAFVKGLRRIHRIAFHLTLA
ncbi:MAG: hypothetical protein KME49_01390 [Brasilonema octagenarum HA4186-MV1]|jgi:hypothetical protein|nr:hypothetical protein [Brasilonema octagenarum HA4186-MV1]